MYNLYIQLSKQNLLGPDRHNHWTTKFQNRDSKLLTYSYKILYLRTNIFTNFELTTAIAENP